MSIVGYFLTITINTANVIGIENAAKFPVNSPGDKEFPTIIKTPTTAKIIENNVIEEIFSLKKKRHQNTCKIFIQKVVLHCEWCLKNIFVYK